MSRRLSCTIDVTEWIGGGILSWDGEKWRGVGDPTDPGLPALSMSATVHVVGHPDHHEAVTLVQADIDRARVRVTPAERPGAADERLEAFKSIRHRQLLGKVFAYLAQLLIDNPTDAPQHQVHRPAESRGLHLVRPARSCQTHPPPCPGPPP